MKKFILFMSVLTLFLPFKISNAQETSSQAASSETPAKIYLESELEEDKSIKIKIMANQIKEPALGIAFDLIYDPENLQFKEYFKGNFFEQGGDPIYLISSSKKDEGKLMIGVSLRRGDELPSGSGEIISFKFKGLKTETSFVDFDNATLASLDSAKKEIKNVSWVGSKIETLNSQNWIEANLLTNLEGISIHLIIEVFLAALIIVLLAAKTNLLEKIMKLGQHKS